MREMRCPDVREVAPDLALGLLTGEERARVLAHLEQCETCRADVASLATAADEVLLAAPEVTPPAGFRDRVLARIATERSVGDGLSTVPGARGGHQGRERARSIRSRTPVRRRGGSPGRRAPGGAGRARTVAAVAAAAVVVLAVAGIAVALLLGGRDQPAVTASTEMRTGSGRVVGEVVASGDPAIVTVDVPAWRSLTESWGGTPGNAYYVSIEMRDGSRISRSVPATGDSWDVAIDAPAGEIVAVSMVDSADRVWCTGRFD